MQKVRLVSRTTPDQDGYGDTCIVEHDGRVVFACPASGCPNPRQPALKGGKEWREAYGWLDTGRYDFECVGHWKYGKSLLLNGGGECSSRSPNPRHGGKWFLSEVFVHKGWSEAWRGSAGCITIHPLFWAGFQYFFEVGYQGDLFVEG